MVALGSGADDRIASSELAPCLIVPMGPASLSTSLVLLHITYNSTAIYHSSLPYIHSIHPTLNLHPFSGISHPPYNRLQHLILNINIMFRLARLAAPSARLPFVRSFANSSALRSAADKPTVSIESDLVGSHPLIAYQPCRTICLRDVGETDDPLRTCSCFQTRLARHGTHQNHLISLAVSISSLADSS